jgi:DNA-binding NarL/FixJ family response regulator
LTAESNRGLNGLVAGKRNVSILQRVDQACLAISAGSFCLLRSEAKMLMTMTQDTITPAGAAVSRVLVCDERPIARTALTAIVMQAIPTVSDVRQSTDGADLVAQYTRKPADLVLIGIRKGKQCGPAAVDQLLSNQPTAPVIVFGCIDDTGDIVSAIGRGARGFLSWDANNPVASPASQRPLNFGRLSPTYDATRVAAQLTERELQILRGMTRGHSNCEIGRKLYLSEDTVKTHARRLFHKLGAHDRAHAVALGLRNGLIA